MSPGTLGALVAERDRARFVGRERELALLEAMLGDDPPPVRVALLHGAGGLGKSTLLRELARRAQDRGIEPVLVEGRDLPPVPEALEAAVAPAMTAARPLLLLDTYERMAALGPYLRASVLPSLPASAVVVIAGRRPPEPAWFASGWETVCADIRLEPLDERDARHYLQARGVAAGATDAILSWGRGSPLAIALAAEAAAGPAGLPADLEQDGDLVDALVRRLAAADSDPAHRDVLAVAALARVVTRDLLAAVLPRGDAAQSLRWLASRSFAEPLGDGVTLHELTGRALRADLRRRDPGRDGELRRRIADALHATAVRDRPELSVELAHLVENPLLRWGYAAGDGGTHRLSGVTDGDAAAIAAGLRDQGLGGWWPGTSTWLSQAPECVSIVRDADERVRGYGVSMTVATAPAFAGADPVVGGWLAHAAARGGNAVLWREAIDLARDPGAPVQALLGMAGMLRSGLGNPRYTYLPIDPMVPGAPAFASALGAEHLPQLDVEHGGVSVQCHVVDYGPGGLLGAQRDVVHRETGVAPPSERVPPDAVRDALRDLHAPHRLARSPLAAGLTAKERADSVVDRLLAAADAAFSDSEEDRLLRRVLQRGYLDRAPSHEAAAAELFLSRAAYFRRLRAAVARVTEHVAHHGPA